VNQVNNEIYHTLGQRWLTGEDDPVALLRAENRFRNPWILERLQALQISPGSRVLDLGCGAGFLARDLADAGYEVTGLDASDSTLEVARGLAAKTPIRYLAADLLHLPAELKGFDVCCLMDVLEHVDSPAQALAQAAQALRPGGLCLFYTFNRNWLSHLLVVKGVEWVVSNVPRHLHLSSHFIRPPEMRRMCAAAHLEILSLKGVGPVIFQSAMWHLLLTGRIRADFRFEFKSNLWVAYLGLARKL
jgi:2-polyprenyl-6-hydroxyphenyl methylase/3-demethylubiquinone-9 3-methyltransferase